MSPVVHDIIRLLFKRKRIILLAFVVVFGPAVIAVLARPTVYRATARLSISQSRAYSQLSAQGDERRQVPVNDLRLMGEAAQSLGTRTFLREVGRILATQTPSGPAEAAPDETAGGGAIQIAEPAAPKSRGEGSERWWTSQLVKNLIVTPHSTAPIIQVSYNSADPELSARVVNTVVEHYIGYQARSMFNSPAVRDFYDERRRILEQDLAAAESQLTVFQEKHQIFALEAQRSQLVRAQAEAVRALALNSEQVRQAEIEAKELTSHLQRLPAQVTLHTYGDSPRIAALNAQVVALELELNDLRQLYTDQDRRVRNAREKLERARDLLIMGEAAIGEMPTTTRLETNDAYQSILENALRQEAAAKALSARGEEIQRELDQAELRLQEFNRLSYEYERRKAERDAKQLSYEKFLTLIEHARSSEAMDEQGLTNVRIIDSATVPKKPVSKQAGLTFAMAFLAALTIGVGGAFGLEAMSGTVHSQRDGEERLALPVLTVIPERE